MWTINAYKSPPTSLQEHEVGVFAVNTGWNDFGYNYQAIARILINGVMNDFPVRILPIVEDKRQKNINSWIEYLFNTKIEARAPNTKTPPFISLFTNKESYQSLARSLPNNEYDELLNDINEINAIHDNLKISSETFKDIIESDQFVLGFLREAAPYMAFRFGYYLARRMPPPEDARIPFNFSAKLHEFKNSHSISLKYIDNELFSDRVHCLIGVNGIGKTRLLRELIVSLQEKVNSLSQDTSKSKLFDFEDNEINELKSSADLQAEHRDELPTFSRVISYSTDPYNILPRKVSHDGSFDYRYSDMGLERNSSLTQMLVDIIRNDSSRIGGESRYTVLKKVIQDIIPISKIMIPVVRNIVGASTILDDNNMHWVSIGAIRGEQLKLEILGLIDRNRDLAFQVDSSITMPLSSGQKIYFKFATHFLTYVDQGTLVVIDEPETHLHPNLITQFMSVLYSVLSFTKSVAIIATHSPYVVREAPSHCVHILKSQDGEIRTENIYMNTLGASASSLSNIVFSDNLKEAFHQKISEYIASSGMSFDEVIERYSSIISKEMLISIREHMRRSE